ncbi:MAG TPA: hypothetical protein VK745_17775 [Polyangiaceae bacterium]|jgi:hypothetical protein|nr:hypothetical protein [Polyangiaceae bacterium]
MASLSALTDWPSLQASDTVDILQVHTYDENLDSALIDAVRTQRAAYGKPVLIGESGLSAAAPTGDTATTSANASLGIRHAIWAGVVSGAMNARSLWWEDGYAIYEPPGLAFVHSYANAEAPAATFVKRLDFTDLRPLTVVSSSDIVGATLGSATLVVGWYRSSACSSPAWSCTTPLQDEAILIAVPGSTSNWNAVFYDTATGAALPQLIMASRSGGVVLTLPPLADDTAFTLTPAN